MSSTALADHGNAPGLVAPERRLFVAWQNPQTREFAPVGLLSRGRDGAFEFAYLRRASTVAGFAPFLGFPELGRTYRSSELFSFFENRIVARDRPDFAGFAHNLGLGADADRFEVLGRSRGLRQTDTIEVFPPPVLEDGHVRSLFLVHSIRHMPGAEQAIDRLETGERLFVMPDPQNQVDSLAVALRTDGYQLLGWVPRYLTDLTGRPMESGGRDAVRISVEHVAQPGGPVHLRLLCRLDAVWDLGHDLPFTGPDYEVSGTMAGGSVAAAGP